MPDTSARKERRGVRDVFNVLVHFLRRQPHAFVSGFEEPAVEQRPRRVFGRRLKIQAEFAHEVQTVNRAVRPRVPHRGFVFRLWRHADQASKECLHSAFVPESFHGPVPARAGFNFVGPERGGARLRLQACNQARHPTFAPHDRVGVEADEPASARGPQPRVHRARVGAHGVGFHPHPAFDQPNPPHPPQVLQRPVPGVVVHHDGLERMGRQTPDSAQAQAHQVLRLVVGNHDGCEVLGRQPSVANGLQFIAIQHP